MPEAETMRGRSRSISECFAVLTDVRTGNHKLHKLHDMLVIALCATICGAESYYDFETFGQCREEWLKRFLGLELPNGIPSHDTFNRTFRSLDPGLFECCFRTWIDDVRATMRREALKASPAPRREVVAVDGKALRSVPTKSGNVPYMVSAWASEQELVIGQVRTDEKSNEITAIPQLLALLALEGCIVTVDAAGCQRRIVSAIRARGADYVIGLKGNQPTMLDEVSLLFEDALRANPSAFRSHTTLDKQGGRTEERTCHQTDALGWFEDLPQWDGLRSVCRVRSVRTSGGVTSEEIRYYISSLPVDPAESLRAIRSHWGIENKLHWILDVQFGEDGSRVRNADAAQNLNVIRKVAVDLLRRDRTTRHTFKKKRQIMMWKDEMLQHIIIGR